MTQSSQVAEPLFETSKEALSFALNYERTRYAAQVVTKVMVEMQAALRAKPKPKRKNGKLVEEMEPEVTAAFRRSSRPSLRGLDRSAQAGMIFMHLAKLLPPERHTLVCSTIHAQAPCSCRNPCCMGWRPNPEFVEGLDALCLILEAGDSPRRKNAHPKIRRMLVEKYFGTGRRIIQSELAEECGVTEQTIVNHKERIHAWLENHSKNGWSRLDEFLVAAGIIGTLP